MDHDGGRSPRSKEGGAINGIQKGARKRNKSFNLACLDTNSTSLE